MKVWLTRIMLGVVAVLIVALVGIAIFLLTFDPNAYKNRVEQMVFERYHRTLSIDGDIELSLFPRIGLSVQDVSLSDRDSASTFASIDSARFAVAIWPLLFNRLVVDHVAVTGFKAWIVRDADGRFNFRDLVRDSRGPGHEPSAPARLALPGPDGQVPGLASPLPDRRPALMSPAVAGTLDPAPVVLAANPVERADFQIDIAGLDLKGGELHFLDRQTGATGRIEQLDLATGRMTFDQAFDVALKGKVVGDWPQMDAGFEGQALVQLDPVARTYSAQRINVTLSGDLAELHARTATLRGNLAYNQYSRMLSASNLDFQVQGEIGGDQPIGNLTTRLSAPQLHVDRSKAELKVTRLAVRASGARDDSDFDLALDAPALSVSPELATGEPVIGTFRINEPGSVLGVSLEMRGLGGDAFDLTLQELKVDSTQKRGDRLVSIQMSSPAAWSPFTRQGGLSAMKGDVSIEDATLPGGRFQFPFIGSVRADLFDDELSAALNAVLGGSKIDFSMAVSQLANPQIAFDLTTDNLDLNTLFPPPAESSAGPADDDAEADGEAPPAPAAEAAAPTPEPDPARRFDWSFLDAVHVQGNIKAKALKAGGLELQGLQAAVNARDGVLQVRDIRADLYGGSLESNLSVSSSHDISLDLAAANVDIRPLAQAFLSTQRLVGTGDFDIDLSTHGVTMPALIAALDGTVRGHVRNGAWVGLDLNRTIAEINDVLRNAFSGQVPEVTSRFDPSRRTSFDTLDVELALQDGQGVLNELDLVSPSVVVKHGTPSSIDLVNRQFDVLLQVTARAGGNDGAAGVSALQGVTVPVRVSGPFDSVSYQVQWQDIGHRAVKDALQGGLLDILSGLPAGSGGSLLFPVPEKPDDSRRDPLKSLGDTLKGLLGQ